LIIQRLQESFHAFQELTEKEAAPDGR
jgi:hypothetical protein